MYVNPSQNKLYILQPFVDCNIYNTGSLVFIFVLLSYRECIEYCNDHLDCIAFGQIKRKCIVCDKEVGHNIVDTAMHSLFYVMSGYFDQFEWISGKYAAVPCHYVYVVL